MSMKGLTVAFDRDVSEEHAKAVADAIRLMYGVGNVSVLPTESNDFFARSQVRNEICDAIREAMRKILRIDD